MLSTRTNWIEWGLKSNCTMTSSQKQFSKTSFRKYKVKCLKLTPFQKLQTMHCRGTMTALMLTNEKGSHRTWWSLCRLRTWRRPLSLLLNKRKKSLPRLLWQTTRDIWRTKTSRSKYRVKTEVRSQVWRRSTFWLINRCRTTLSASSKRLTSRGRPICLGSRTSKTTWTNSRSRGKKTCWNFRPNTLDSMWRTNSTKWHSSTRSRRTRLKRATSRTSCL